MANGVTPEQISVIISTYNSPGALDKALLAYTLQTDQPFEIVVADDGSGPDTADVVERYRQTTDLAIQHVWQEDQGFRKCEVLNRAIDAASGDYLIFTDGDCIPRRDFVQVHRQEAEPGWFLSGSYNNLPPSFSELITREQIASGAAFSAAWLRRNGMPWSRKAVRLVQQRLLMSVLNAITPTHATWNGCNSSGWKSDLAAVNGFDQRMRYGGEDRELGLRLENAGVSGKQIRYKAICLHVDHPRDYVNQADLDRNREIRQVTNRCRLTHTEHGIRRAA